MERIYIAKVVTPYLEIARRIAKTFISVGPSYWAPWVEHHIKSRTMYQVSGSAGSLAVFSLANAVLEVNRYLADLSPKMILYQPPPPVWSSGHKHPLSAKEIGEIKGRTNKPN